MQIPLHVVSAADAPAARRGRYIVDFGNETVAGFTSRQVSEMLESERFRHIQVYKVLRTDDRGRREIVGVPRSRFGARESLLFMRRHRETAESDFVALREAAARRPPPCTLQWSWSLLVGGESHRPPYMLELSFPADSADEIGAWLVNIGFRGGDDVMSGNAAGHSGAGVVQTMDSTALPSDDEGPLATN